MDTSAICALAFDEPGADKVLAHLRQGGCIMHAVNTSEICFTLPRKRPGHFNRQSARAWLIEHGIRVFNGFDETWADAVAEIRLENKALNIGDGVAVALAASLEIPLLVAEKAFEDAADCATINLIR